MTYYCLRYTYFSYFLSEGIKNQFIKKRFFKKIYGADEIKINKIFIRNNSRADWQ